MVRPPDDIIERKIYIQAQPETVFDFLTDPVKMTRWMGLHASLEPMPGGTYEVDINGRDIARGEYVEVDPPHRIVFTIGWEGDESPIPPSGSTVTFNLKAKGDGTLLHFRHAGLPPDAYPTQEIGWDHYLPRLATVASGGDPGPDPWAQDMR